MKKNLTPADTIRIIRANTTERPLAYENWPTKQFSFNFADFRVRLFTENTDLQFKISENYKYFVSQLDENIQSDVEIEVVAGIPKEFEQAPVTFEAPHEVAELVGVYANLWEIRQMNSHFYIAVNSPDLLEFPYSVLCFELNNANWKLYIKENRLGAPVDPFLYPLGSLMMQYVAIQNNAIMVHGAGIDDGKGYIFSGFSGAGKSTISGIWTDCGARLINDDRLIVRSIYNEVRIYNIPMFYCDTPRSTTLHEIHLLKQAPYNRRKKLSSIRAFTGFMAFCMQHDFNKELVTMQLQSLRQIIAHVRVFELSFLPEKSVVELLRTND